MKNSQVRLEQVDAQTLRNIAAAFGYTIRRGVGAGEEGNAAALIEELTAAYWRDPDAVLNALGLVIHNTKRNN